MATQSETPKVSKIQAVKQQMQEFPDLDVGDAVDWINTRFGLDISKSMYSSYKSQIKSGKLGVEDKDKKHVRQAPKISLEDVRKLKKGLREHQIESPLETANSLKPLIDEFGSDFNRFYAALCTLDELRSDEELESEEKPVAKSKK